MAGVLSGRIELPSQEKMIRDVETFYLEMEARGSPKRYTHGLGIAVCAHILIFMHWKLSFFDTYCYNLTTRLVVTLQFEYEDWLVEQCGLESIEEWRKLIYVAAKPKMLRRPESYRDEWDDDHLLAQAHHDFKKYI